MFKPNQRLKKYYARFNKEFFDGVLPKDTEVGENEEIEGYGLTLGVEDEDTKHRFFHIHIDPKKHFDKKQICLTLIHEMVHVKLYPKMTHGKLFHEEMKRLAGRDAFKKYW